MRHAICLALLFTVLVSVVTPSSGSFIGIDLGGQWMKVAIVKPGRPIEMVETDSSKRKSPTAIGWNPKETPSERHVGESATGLLTKFPKQTIQGFVSLVGQTPESAALGRLRDTFKSPVEWVPTSEPTPRDPNNNVQRIGAKIDDQVYTVDELLAMLLEHAKDLSIKSAGGTVRDAVITVPPHWKEGQRQALMDAASIAGLNVVSLINTDTAVALNYAKSLEFPDETHTVLFYDIGSYETKASLVSFSKGKAKGSDRDAHNIKVLDVAWESNVGSLDWDAALVNHFAAEILSKHDLDVFSTPRSLARLKIQCEKIKIILSANSETPVSIEGLFPDVDFSSSITREKFEELTSPLSQAVLTPVRDLLDRNPDTPLSAVVLMGGGTRIPSLQRQLSSFLGRDLDHSVNTDEAGALGAAFYAAMKSPSVRLAVDYNVKDITPYELIVTVADGSSNETSNTLFGVRNKLPSKKSMNFSRTSDLNITLAYASDLEAPIGQWAVTGVADFLDTKIPKDELNAGEDDKKAKISLSIHLTSSGLVELHSAEASADIFVEKRVPIQAPEGDGNSVETPEGSEVAEDTQDAQASTEDSAEDSEATQDGSGTDKDEAAADDNVQYETSIEKESVSKMLSKKRLYSKSPLPPLSSETRVKAMTKLREIKKLEEVKVKTAEAKNILEATIYEQLDKIEGSKAELLTVATQADMDTVVEALNEASLWLYDEGDSTTLEAYLEKTDSISSLYTPIWTRLSESKLLPDAVESVRKALESGSSLVSTWNTDADNEETSIYATSRLTKETVEAFQSLLKSTQDWFDEALPKWEASTPFETAPWTSAELLKAREKLDKKSGECLKKSLQKPFVPKPKKIEVPDPDETADSKPSSDQDPKPPQDESSDHFEPPPSHDHETDERAQDSATPGDQADIGDSKMPSDDA